MEHTKWAYYLLFHYNYLSDDLTLSASNSYQSKINNQLFFFAFLFFFCLNWDLCIV